MNEQQRKAYQQKVQAQLDQWNAELEKRRARASEASADAQLKGTSQLEELRNEARERLAALQVAGEAGWDEAKRSLDSVLGRARAAYEATKVK